MLKNFTKHPSKQGETYLQHMWSAWQIAWLLISLTAKCMVHSVFPFLYTNAISSKIECLNKMTNRKDDLEEDLYEVYGGE